MPDIVTAINFALNSDVQRLDSISQNVANVNTQGYKRSQISQAGFDATVQQMQAVDPASVERMLLESSPVRVSDFSQGAINFTGNNFHMAFKGKAMMQVGEGDEVLFTRRGDMHIDAQGRLSLTNGQVVNGEQGYIFLQSKPFSIDKSGVVTQDERVIGKVALLELYEDSDWQSVGMGLYKRPANVAALPESNTQVLQGYLEASNVNTTDEMIHMIETSRHFQTSHQVLKAYDQMLDKSINDIGNF